MTSTEPSPDNQQPSPTSDDGTGLAGLRSWNALYLFVVAVFLLWVTLLHLLTRAFS